MMAVPLISVVIASYNYAQYLPTAIESVLGQDDENFELIVVDNQSTDTSWEITLRYASADFRLRPFQNQKNIGITPNHNAGLREARGTHVIFLSADDFFLPGHLRTLRAILSENPDCDVAYTNAMMCDEDGRMYRERRMIGEPPFDTGGRRNEFGLLMMSCFMCLPTMLIPKRFYDELGPFDETIRVAADWEMSLRIARAGARFATRRIPTVAVRLHGPQASGSASYYSTGGDVEDTLFLYEKYITLENAKDVRVYARSIKNVLDWKVNELAEGYGADALGALNQKRVERVRDELDVIDSGGPFIAGREPLVAVIVPSIGRFSLLREALQSLVDQSYVNWHAYVLRETGADFSAYLETIAGLKGRYTYVDAHGRHGPAAVRNLALAVADGDLVAYLDEDNTWSAQHLRRAVDTLHATGKRAVFSRARLAIDEDAGTRRRTVAQNLDLFRADLDWRSQAVGNSLPLNAVVHDRALFERIGGFNESFQLLEDWEFLARLEAHDVFAFVAEVTVDVHAHVGLEGQWFHDQMPNYARYLDMLYGLVSVTEQRLIDGRAAQRGLVEQLMLQAPTLAATPQGIFDVYSVITGALALRNTPVLV